MSDIKTEVLKSIEEFKTMVEGYKSGALDPLRFKAFRVGMGVYEQRKKETYMLRTRMPGGIVSLKQLEAVSEMAKNYANGKIHFTSRQDVQFHDLNIDNLYNMMKELIEVGIISKGTGGNTVRNVACSALSGVSSNDVFDVSEYASSVTNYLMKDPSTMNLPRKYKIAFSNSPEDTGNATVSDLGFIAKIVDGKKGFEVYGAGGFGGSPRASLKLSDFIEDKDVLYYAQAMKELFEEYGDRSNKHKARIRYIVGRLGEEEFVRLFNEKLQKVKNEKNLDLNIGLKQEDEQVIDKNEVIVPEEYKNALYPQKQKDLYSVYVHPQSGNINTADLDKILNFLKGLNYEASIRVTNTQGFFVRDLKIVDAHKLLDIMADFSSKFLLYNSVTCTGANTCQLGLCLPQTLLTAIKEKFKDAAEEVKSALPRLFISGCPNSCGQHEKGAIGLNGKAKRTEDGLVPVYTVAFGGYVGQGGAKIAEAFGDVPAKKIPGFLLELAVLKNESGHKDFFEFLEDKKEEIITLLNKYSSIETFNENSDLYYDFGACDKFSLKDRGAGECSTGALDVIKLDLSNAEASLDKFKSGKDSLDLYSAAVSSSRALLVLKGVDSNKDREIFKEFIKHFVDTGFVKEDVKELIDTLLDYKLGDVKDISEKLSEVEYVVNKVKAMFESLDGKLEITLPKETEYIESLKNSSNVSDEKADVVDFRGVQCPINFVKVKIELSKIKSGEQRAFYLDDGAPIENVPKSVEKEGHKIVEINTNFDGYNLLLIEKK